MLEKTQSTEIENIYNRNKNKYILEKVSKNIFFISSLIAVLSLLLIIGFVFYKGLTPFIFKGYSFVDFFTFSSANLAYIIHAPSHHGKDIQDFFKENPTRITAFENFREDRTIS